MATGLPYQPVCFGDDIYACPFNVSANISYFREGCPPKETNGIPIGIALGCLGSVGINLGNNLQALGMNVQASQLAEHIQMLDEQGYDLDGGAAADLPKLSKLSRFSLYTFS